MQVLPAVRSEGRRRIVLFAVAIVAAVVSCYANSLSGPFIYDDIDSICENPHLGRWWPPWRALSAPPRTTVSGRPIVCLSLALNHAVGGFDVWGYHLVNVMIHVMNVLLVFGIVRRTFASPALAERFGRAALYLAAASALLWGVHPLQTEAVTYIIQRTELLMGFFFLLTLYCAIRGWCGRRPRALFLTAVAACAIGMGCKEAMVVAPLAALLYDRMFVSDSFGTALRRHPGLYLGLAATWILLAWLNLPGPRRHSVGLDLGVSSRTYLQTQAGVILWYLRLALWPHPLTISYDGWPMEHRLVHALPQGLAVTAMLAATAWAVWRRHPLGFLGGWFFLILAPTSSVVPIVTEVAAERRMYLPLAAVVVGFVTAGYAASARLASRFRMPARVVLGVGAGSVLALSAALGAATVIRNRDYRSERSIWADAVRKAPENPLAHFALGDALARAGQAEDAIACYREAVRLRPAFAEAHNNLGNLLLARGEVDEAVKHFQEAARVKFPGGLRAYPKTPAARNVIHAQAKWSKAT